MDRDTLKLTEDVLEELQRALTPLGVRLRRVDLKDSGGFPTVLAGVPEKNAEQMVCTVLPDMVGGMGVVFLQFYQSLTPPAGPEQLEKLDRFVQAANRRFMLGTLLTRNGRMDLRYVLALDPAAEMDEDHIQTTAAVLFHQAAIYIKLGHEIISGGMTVEQALDYRE